jgi:hypothetical protein
MTKPMYVGDISTEGCNIPQELGLLFELVEMSPKASCETEFLSRAVGCCHGQ